MERRRETRWKNFLLAFTLTMVLLSVIMIATVMAVQPSMPQSSQQEEATAPPSYHPQAEDSLTLVAIGKNAKGDATDFLLVRFNPQYGQIPIALLSPDTLVRQKGASLTLQQAYAQGGSNAVKSALSERFGIVVDRYATLTHDPFLRIAEQIGTVVYTLPYDVAYEQDGYTVNLSAGSRRLDGQDVANLFAYPGFRTDPVEKSKVLGDLTAALVNQNLSAAGEARSSALFKLVVNLIDTDVSSADYEYRRRSADFLAGLEAQAAGSLPVQGAYLEDGVSFELSESYVSLVRQYFETAS